MFKIARPIVAALGLAAFAAQGRTVDVQPQGMGWILSHDGAIAKLAYGAPNSDHLALMMTCMPGDATAVLYGDVQPVSARLIAASNGPAPLDPLSGGDAVENRIPVDDAALHRLANAGRLPVRGEDAAYDLTADRQDRRVVGDFLAYCGADRA